MTEVEWNFLEGMMRSLGYARSLDSQSLSCLINEASRANKIHGLRFGQLEKRLTHLLFADDCLIFMDATVEEGRAFTEVLQKYSDLSGQCINFSKSNLCVGRKISQAEGQRLASSIGVTFTENHSKYLGLPAFVGRNKREAFGLVRNKVWDKLQGWKMGLFSQAGREGILWGRELLLKGTRWRVNDGRKVRINEDKWIPRGPPFTLRTPAEVPPNSLVETLINEAGDWKLEAIEEKMNKDDIPWILGIQTIQDSGEDGLIWNPTLDGEYTVASGYRMKQSEKEGAETSNKSITTGWWTAVWHSNLTPKVKNFIWRVCHNWVPSKTELAKRGIKLDRTSASLLNRLKQSVMLYGNVLGSREPLLLFAIEIFKGNLVAAEVKYHHGFVSILMAKCMALRLGLHLSHKMNTTPFYLTSDNQTAINHLLTRKVSRTDWGMQLKDILGSHLLDDCIEIRYVNRDSNRVAHSLTRWAYKLKSNSFWSEVLPSCAAAILDAEKPDLV
uniref:Reverse transcriptase n=1 Tax=Cannabis sativa TaxID=3483 RepID=A0A803NY26_CANSA